MESVCLSSCGLSSEIKTRKSSRMVGIPYGFGMTLLTDIYTDNLVNEERQWFGYLSIPESDLTGSEIGDMVYESVFSTVDSSVF
jgi:hypothetical protein